MRIPTYRGTSRVSINMTPMIDVTFLLIIFFLVSSHLAKQENFVKLDLPNARSGMNDLSEKPTFTLQILADGTYRNGTQDVALDQIRRALQQRNSTEELPVRVRLRMDRRTPYQYVAAVLQTCSITRNSDVVFSVYDEESP